MPIRFEVEDAIACITIGRPGRRNALDQGHYDALSAAWCRVRDDTSIRAAIITGAGDQAFCAGADLKSFVGAPPSLAALAMTQSGQLLNRGLEVWKPVIAAVNGEPLCKRLQHVAGQVLLRSENPRYAPRYIMEGDDFMIWGVVTFSVRSHDPA